MGKKKKHPKVSKRNTPQTKASSKKTYFIVAIVVVLVIGGFFISDFYKNSSSFEKSKVQQAEKSKDPSILRGWENQPTLSPANFTGNTARAYNIAKENRELLDRWMQNSGDL